MDRRWLAWMLGVFACDPSGEGTDTEGNQMSASESGGESGDPPDAACIYTPTILPDVDAAGITGVSASEVLAEAQGTFTGQIQWLDDAPPLTYTGSTDPTALTLTVTYAGGEIRSIDATPGQCEGLEGCQCEPRLEIDVTWRLVSADGVLDETWDAPLLHEPRSWHMSKPIGISTRFGADETTGSLSAASFGGEGELQWLEANFTFRNGAAEGSIDSQVLWNEWAGFGPAATIGALKDGANDLACHELTDAGACALAGCVDVPGAQQILDCQCADYDETFCFATAPDLEAPMTWYTHPAGDTWDEYEQVVALPSFGDAIPEPWRACTDAPDVPGCACASEAPACG